MEQNTLIVQFGKYNGQAIERLPAFYLARVYMSNPEVMEQYPAVKQFIEINCAALLLVGKPVGPICDTLKAAFVDKEAADKELKRIRKDPRKHKKPVRSYECERCGFWHHTSKPE